MDIQLIRHGATEGNKLGRYIGVTDEGLSEEGKKELSHLNYPVPEKLFVSPMKRCRETAELLFPQIRAQVVPGFAECNFGEFENKNYKELEGNPHYQEWVDGMCEGPIPGGEQMSVFCQRTLLAFDETLEACIAQGLSDIAIVAHGGTIMAVMQKLAREEKPFYDWYVKNGHGYRVNVHTKEWSNGRKQFLEIKNI